MADAARIEANPDKIAAAAIAELEKHPPRTLAPGQIVGGTPGFRYYWTTNDPDAITLNELAERKYVRCADVGDTAKKAGTIGGQLWRTPTRVFEFLRKQEGDAIAAKRRDEIERQRRIARVKQGFID